MTTHVLVPHPGTRAPILQSLTVRLEATAASWRLRYRLRGELSRLRLPAAAAQPGPRDGLWQHCCLELFVGSPDSPAYREFNFSPSGDWAAYAFSGLRQHAGPDQIPVHPRLSWQHDDRSAQLDVQLPATALPAPDAGLRRLGLSAVLESLDGELSYWALQHPAERPDFHDPAGWATIALP